MFGPVEREKLAKESFQSPLIYSSENWFMFPVHCHSSNPQHVL